MATDEFSVPAHVIKKLKELGYSVDNSMDTYIQAWYDWYSGKADWYKDAYTDKRSRLTIRPAKRVASEWASLLVTDDTQVSVEGAAANEWLQDFLDRANFWPTGQLIVEKAFALGTAAWALWFDVRDGGADVKVRRYDARMVRPLSWDEEGVAECAFVTRASVKGKRADQLQVHAWDAETASYHIRTYLFVDSREQDAEAAGILEDIVFAYGYDEEIGGNARLFLNKADLAAIGKLRDGDNHALYKIIPDPGNANTGRITDGGLIVPYTIGSALTALSGSTAGSADIQTMLYGDPMNYELGLFGPYSIRIDESVKAVERMNTILGDVMVGGNLIAKDGFCIATLAKSGS